MVVATFWCSYIAAYKLWKCFFGTDSATVANMILQQSLKNNSVKKCVKTEGMELTTTTTFSNNDGCVPMEWEPTTAYVQEIPIVIATDDAIEHERTFEIEGITSVKEIQTEQEVVHGIAHEFSLEVQTVSEFVPEFAFEIESISSVKEIPLGKEIVCGIASELSLEEQTETAIELVPEIAFELQNVSAVRDINIPFEEEVVCGIAQELSVEEETVSEFVSEVAFELQNVSAVRDISFEEEMVCGIAQELSLEEQTAVSSDSAVPEFACEIENISAVQEIPFEDEIVCGVAHKFSSEQQTVSFFTQKFAIEGEAVKPVNETPLEEEMLNVVVHEVSTEITSVSAAVEPLNKVISDVPLLVDSSTKESLTSIGLETKALATPAEKSQSAKSCTLGLNAEAHEFVPEKTRFPELASFGGVSDGTAALKNREKTGVDGHDVEDAVRLNAWAKEFVPSSVGVSGETTGVPNREDTGSAKSERSLNAFAREFVPFNFQSNVGVHPNHSNAPTMAPVYRPASPHPAPGFRPRGQAGIQHRLPSGRFLPHHPRVRPRFHGAQQVSPYVMRPRWSTTDR